MNETKNTNMVVTWRTSKNENGTFTGTCIKIGYQLPTETLWTGTYKTRAIAKARAKQATRYFKAA